jgi:hypothetical protein
VIEFKRKILLCALVSSLFLAAPSPARASQDCETMGPAMIAYGALFELTEELFMDFIQQEGNFMYDKLIGNSLGAVLKRLDNFDDNIRNGMSNLWKFGLLPAMQDMTDQITLARIEQTMQIGMMVDAELINETTRELELQEIESRKRYPINESSCQADTVSPGATKAFRASRALAGAYVKEGSAQNMNAKPATASPPPGSPAAIQAAIATSKSAAQKVLWKEYVDFFCDKESGDQGCATSGSLKGQNTDLPSVLWGDRQTLDISTPENQRVVNAVQRYLISPTVHDTISSEVLALPSGQEAFLTRRSHAARKNTIYNALTQMISTRAKIQSDTGDKVADVRAASGIALGDINTDPSYSEIQQAMGKERFVNKDYIVKLLSEPESLIKEQGTVNSIRLQQMNDLYKRMEEAVFMEAAIYSAELDSQAPRTGFKNSKKKN